MYFKPIELELAAHHRIAQGVGQLVLFLVDAEVLVLFLEFAVV
jgi:hypothetical protein